MTHEQRRDIEKLAYLIWERGGRPSGRALDHWLEAEYLVLTGVFGQSLEMPPATSAGGF